MATIYLAGPITSVKRDDAENWRVKAAEILAGKYGHLVCDPNQTWCTKDQYIGNSDMRCDQTDKECGAIVATDLAAVRAADALFVWCDRDVPSWGTAIEVGYAVACEKPKVFGFYSPNGKAPGFVRGLVSNNPENTYCYDSLAALCAWINMKLEEAK